MPVDRTALAPGPPRPRSPRLWGRPFLLLWLSETAFDAGAALMGFALGVWVFETTGSAEQFAWTVLANTLPALLVLAFAGALADRADRRRVIACCDLLAALLVGALALQLLWGQLQVLHLYLFNAATATVGAVRNPAFRATISLVVPKDSLTRANGAMGLSEGLLQVVAPLVAGYVMASHGLAGIMVIEVLLVLAGAAMVFAALASVSRAVDHPAGVLNRQLLRASLDSLGQALACLRQRPLLLALLAYVVLQESLLVLITAMITPLVLSSHSSEELGLVLTIGALGGMAGAGLMVLRKLSHHLMLWVLATDALMALAIATAGLTQSLPVWCACAFVAMGAGTASATCAGALWMRKLPRDRQGGVFALIDGLHVLATCVVVVAGGMLGERLLQPALMPGGAWADTLGSIVGVGPGRGYGFLFTVSGTLCALASLLALTRRPMRQLDTLLADQAYDDGQAPPDPGAHAPSCATACAAAASPSSTPPPATPSVQPAADHPPRAAGQPRQT